MSVKEILKLESDIVTDKPVIIPFEFKDKSQIPEGKCVREYIVITPIKVGTWFKIKPMLALIEKEDIDKLAATKENPFSDEKLIVVEKYTELLFDIMCVGIHNKSGAMPDWFKEVLKDNCTFEDMYILLNAILFRIGINPFMSTITLLNRMSPISEAEIIALQKNKESWIRKAATSSLQL